MDRTLLVSGLMLFFAFSASPAIAEEPETAEPDTKGIELFEKQIKPVLIEQCYECHSNNGNDIEGGLELDSPSGMARGGDSGPVVLAHDTNNSMLLRMLRYEDDVSGMPPEEQLSEETVQAFEEWIRLGAPDNREETGPTAKEQRLNASRGHWAFQPPRAVVPPAVQRTDWPRDATIDTFLLARMEAAGVKPVGDANRQTLVRRVYFDLVGLPPSPKRSTLLSPMSLPTRWPGSSTVFSPLLNLGSVGGVTGLTWFATRSRVGWSSISPTPMRGPIATT